MFSVSKISVRLAVLMYVSHNAIISYVALLLNNFETTKGKTQEHLILEE